MGTSTYFSSYFTNSVNSIYKSKAKIFKFDVNLFLIKCDDFLPANMNNFTFYMEKCKFKLHRLLTVYEKGLSHFL